jgi:DNA-directed RNA polymerase subunit RPC12/RpoP
MEKVKCDSCKETFTINMWRGYLNLEYNSELEAYETVCPHCGHKGS